MTKMTKVQEQTHIEVHKSNLNTKMLEKTQNEKHKENPVEISEQKEMGTKRKEESRIRTNIPR